MLNRHNSIYSIDYFSYTSNINHWNPCFKVTIAFLSLLFCIISDNIYVLISVFFSMSALTVVKGRLNLFSYLSMFCIPFFFAVMGSVAVLFDFSAEKAGQYFINLKFFYIYTSDKKISETLKLTIKLVSALSSMYMMILSTPASEIIMSIQRLHIPKLIVELMNLIYRFIFIILETYMKMKVSAQSRLGFSDFKNSFHSFGKILSSLLIVSLKKADIYYNSLISRCYRGEILFLNEEKKITKSQMFFVVLYFIILIVIWIFT